MKGDMLQGGAKAAKCEASKEGSCEEHTAAAGMSDTDGEG